MSGYDQLNARIWALDAAKHKENVQVLCTGGNLQPIYFVALHGTECTDVLWITHDVTDRSRARSSSW
jgi:hypothetical protein